MAASMLAPGSEVTIRPNRAPSSPGGQAGAVHQGAEVVALASPTAEQGGRGVAGGLGVARVLGANGGGPLVQVLHLGHAQQQGLAAPLGGAAAAVHADVEGALHRCQHLLTDAVGALERPDDLALDDVARPDGLSAASDDVNGELVLGGAPVPLQALGGYSCAYGTAEGHPLGEAAVVAVEQRGRVGVEGVNLQEPRGGHWSVSSLWSMALFAFEFD